MVKPLTADDVIFTYQDIYLNNKIPTLYKDLLRIGSTDTFPSVQKLDRAAEFSLLCPNPLLLF